MRVSFLTIMPTPYVEDMFCAMREHAGIDLRVYYVEAASPNTHWRRRVLPEYARILSGRWFRFLGARLHVNSGFIEALERDRPDVVVIGSYAGLTAQAAMHFLRWRRVPWIFWGEVPGFERRGKVGQAFRWLAQRPVVHWADGIAAIGERAARVYRKLARPGCPVWNLPYVCDLEPFFRTTSSAKLRGENESDRPSERQAKVRFLFCGQLIERKGVDLLLDAFSVVAKRFSHVELTLVGEGPGRAQYESMVPESLRSRFHFLGFRQTEDLPSVFADADVFVLPSRHDGWGVVINQAVAAGLAVIASDAVGAAHDLIAPGETGTIVPAGDARALAAAMGMFAADPEKAKLFGERARRSAPRWSPQTIAQRWHRLFQQTLERRKRMPLCA